MKGMKIAGILLPVTILLMSGCVTMSGTYVVTAQDMNRQKIPNSITTMADGRGIYTVRNALCSKYPKAIVIIKDAKTGEELKGESPHQCR